MGFVVCCRRTRFEGRVEGGERNDVASPNVVDDVVSISGWEFRPSGSVLRAWLGVSSDQL